MATRILTGNRINEDDKPGAVFYDGTTGQAFGPVFDSTEDAESFTSFLAGIDPGRLHDWHSHPETSDALRLYGLWIECGKKPQRTVFQFGEDFLYEDRDDTFDEVLLPAGDPVVTWGMSCSLVEHCFPLFNGYNNNEVLGILKKHKVVTKADDIDSESSCIYARFKSKKAALAYLKRLNDFLKKNWVKAYPAAPKAKRAKR